MMTHEEHEDVIMQAAALIIKEGRTRQDVMTLVDGLAARVIMTMFDREVIHCLVASEMHYKHVLMYMDAILLGIVPTPHGAAPEDQPKKEEDHGNHD